MNTVILCNGETPSHDIALKALREADHIVCCDGAIDHLAQYGTLKADIHLVGDGDSYHGGLDEIQFHPDPDQETNDLTKAVKYCLLHGWKTLSILGATGLREDHTLGNISLLGQYAQMGVEATMITNYGTFTTLTHSASFKSFARQQVSIFSLTPDTPISVSGLRFPIENRPLRQWWEGTLNEAETDTFKVNFTQGTILIFQTHVPKA
ncbi:MAG: thiamine diphosphokinase [Bacteroidales bacterium]|nr:thiamine diphosphokinase [Bacteroidales bacterium]